MRAREGTLRNLRTLYASRFCARRVLDGFFHIERSGLGLEIEYAKGEESTATGLTTDPLDVVIFLCRFLIPVMLLRRP